MLFHLVSSMSDSFLDLCLWLVLVLLHHDEETDKKRASCRHVTVHGTVCDIKSSDALKQKDGEELVFSTKRQK